MNGSLPCHRRTFLRAGSAALLSGSVPLFIPAQVLGRAGSPCANDQIVLGVIGMGVRGDQLVLNVPRSGRVAAICDADARKSAAVAGKHKADWKIYHDDMVQYALGMDQSGPVELWPIEEGPTARVRFRYANGVEVRLSFPDEEPRRGPQLAEGRKRLPTPSRLHREQTLDPQETCCPENGLYASRDRK